MIEYIKGKQKVVAAFVASALGAAVLAFGTAAHAAVDTDVAAAASTTVSTLKENILGVVTSNIGLIATVAAAIVGITLLYRLLRRMAR